MAKRGYNIVYLSEVEHLHVSDLTSEIVHDVCWFVVLLRHGFPSRALGGR